jgi:hypothetical protein
MFRQLRNYVIVIACTALNGCGFAVPEFSSAGTGPADFSPFVSAVTGHIACELRNAVLYSKSFEEIKKWSAEVTLRLEVDERTALASGLTYAASPVFSLGLGGGLTGESNRYLELTWYVFFDKYFKEADQNSRDCSTEGPYPISGDLKITQSLYSAIYSVSAPDTAASTVKFGPLKVAKHHVSFEVIANGSFSPGWKFTDITVNSGGPLFDAKRARRDDLLITMGRSEQVPSGPRRIAKPEISSAVQQSHFVGQIDQAFRSFSRGF